MNCSDLAKITGWTCTPSGQNSIRATAPFSLDEGHFVTFYIASPTADTFYITDAGETVMYAEHRGIDVSKKRLELLNETYSITMAAFDAHGEITATGKRANLQFALWDAVKLAFAFSFKKEKWLPKFHQEQFKTLVFNELSSQLGADRIISKAKAPAASGNIIEFPIGIQRKDGMVAYITPIALEEDHTFNWHRNIYPLHGKFSDVKALSDINNRFTIIQKGGQEPDLGRTINFLTEISKVITFERKIEWENIFEIS